MKDQKIYAIITEKEVEYYWNGGLSFDYISFKSDLKHEAFAKALPYIMDDFNRLEMTAQDFIKFLLDSDINGCTKALVTLSNRLQNIHDCFKQKTFCNFYLADIFTTYLYRTGKWRMYKFWSMQEYYPGTLSFTQPNNLDSIAHLSGIEAKYGVTSNAAVSARKKVQEEYSIRNKPEYSKFAESFHKYLAIFNQHEQNAYSLITELLCPDTDKAALHLSHPYEPLEDDPELYMTSEQIEKLQKLYDGAHVFSKIEKVSDLIREYFSLIVDISPKYPTLSFGQIIALYLSSNQNLHSYMRKCKTYTRIESFYMICRFYMMTQNNVDMTTSNYANEITDNLYPDFIDALDLDESNRQEIESRVKSFYPPALTKYLNATLIELDDFESLMLNEFAYILADECGIMKCAACNKYFISHKRNVRYCKDHCGKSSSYQKKHLKGCDVNKVYKAARERMCKRKERGNITQAEYAEWLAESGSIREEYANLPQRKNTTEAFQEKLAELDARLYKDKNIEPPRSYKKRKSSV